MRDSQSSAYGHYLYGDFCAGEIRSAVLGADSATQKQRLRDSRVLSTQHIVQAISQAKQRPTVLVSASAIGYYGDRGDETLDESSGPGAGFLAEACRAWEQAVEPAERMRVVRLRIGIVLSPAGGALGRMLLPFSLGMGGRIGGGLIRRW